MKFLKTYLMIIVTMISIMIHPMEKDNDTMLKQYVSTIRKDNSAKFILRSRSHDSINTHMQLHTHLLLRLSEEIGDTEILDAVKHILNKRKKSKKSPGILQGIKFFQKRWKRDRKSLRNTSRSSDKLIEILRKAALKKK